MTKMMCDVYNIIMFIPSIYVLSNKLLRDHVVFFMFCQCYSDCVVPIVGYVNLTAHIRTELHLHMGIFTYSTIFSSQVIIVGVNQTSGGTSTYQCYAAPFDS